MNRLKKAFLTAIFILFIATITSYMFRNKLIFQAVKLPHDYQFVFDQPFEEYFITTPDDNSINALWFKPVKKAKGLVIYFHGNADNLQRWGQYAIDITQLGYEVLMIDYRGYGKSSGAPAEEILYKDASFIYQWAREKSDHKKIVLYGRSLGSAVASHLAAEVNPALLILETPFDELKGANILRHLVMILPFNATFSNKEMLGKVTCKIIIIHGTDDWVVSLKSAERLRPLLKETDQFIIIPDGGHRNLRKFPLYHTTLASVL